MIQWKYLMQVLAHSGYSINVCSLDRWTDEWVDGEVGSGQRLTRLALIPGLIFLTTYLPPPASTLIFRPITFWTHGTTLRQGCMNVPHPFRPCQAPLTSSGSLPRPAGLLLLYAPSDAQYLMDITYHHRPFSGDGPALGCRSRGRGSLLFVLSQHWKKPLHWPHE